MTSCPHKLAVCQVLLSLFYNQSSFNPEGFSTVTGLSGDSGGVAAGGS